MQFESMESRMVLVERKLPLVLRTVDALGIHHADREDLCNVGAIGLFKALDLGEYADEAALDARIGELVRAEVLRYLQEQGISPEPEEPADLQKALAELPDEERAVVTLRLGLGEDPGLSQAETAQKLGVPEERVSLLLKRGLQRIRRHL